MVGIVEKEFFSNKEDFDGAIYVVDGETGEPIDATGLTDLKIQLEDPTTGTPELQGSYVGGEVVAQDLALGTFTFFFPATSTAKLMQQRYIFAGTFFKDGRTKTIFRARITTYDGIVD